MDITSVIDDGLEISVIGSFSRIGAQVRRRVFGWQRPPDGALRGQTVLVTGPTSGLGRAATGELADLGARVILVGRDHAKLAAVRDELVAQHGEDRFPIVVADTGSLASVAAAVDRIIATEGRLDVIVDNAGALFDERHDSPDGIEATFAVLVVGPFALIAGLLPLLRRSPRGRVIAVTSGGQYTQSLDLDDLQGERVAFSGPRAYARAKRAQTALMREWARRLAGTTVSFNAMHPGWADTPGIAASLPGFYGLMRPILRTPAEGIDTIVWLAADPAAAGRTGRLFLDRRPRPYDRIPGTRLSADDRRRLWGEVVALARIADPATEG